MDKLTICKNCKFLQDAKNLWDRQCLASPKPIQFDPYDGKELPESGRFEVPHMINSGACPKFEPKAS
jgi:hypothetical protein